MSSRGAIHIYVPRGGASLARGVIDNASHDWGRTWRGKRWGVSGTRVGGGPERGGDCALLEVVFALLGVDSALLGVDVALQRRDTEEQKRDTEEQKRDTKLFRVDTK